MSARQPSQARTFAALLAFLLVVAPVVAPAAQAIPGAPTTDEAVGAVDSATGTLSPTTDAARAAATRAVPALATAFAALDAAESQANQVRYEALALLGQDAAWRDEIRAIPERLYGLMGATQQAITEAREALDPRPYLTPIAELVAEQAALVEELRIAVADATDLAEVPVRAEAPDEAVEHEHVEAHGYGEGEHAEGQAGRVLLDDLADDLDHRAYFATDRNWAVTGSPISVTSLSKPKDTLTAVQWHFDEHPITGTGFVGGPSAASAAAIVPSFGAVDGIEGAKLTVRPMRTGLHHLTLTATWVEGGVTYQDRVTTPIYVEDPAIATLQPLPPPAAWEADIVGTLTSLDAGDVEGAAVHTVATLEGLLLADRPTVLLISDFLGGYAPPAGVLAPTRDALTMLADTVAGFDPDAGLGQIDARGVTDYGADITHHGGAMAATMVQAGLANVIFASGIDPDTGILDRAAIRNALLYAKHSGNVDAIVWGLPASAYLPGALQNSARPNLHFQATPMVPMDALDPLPTASRDWRTASHMPPDTSSVLTDLMKLGFSMEPGADGSGLIGKLHANMDQVYNRYKPLVEAVHADLSFDSFLQNQILALGEAGIPMVVPAEECEALADTYMTVLGISHLVGTYTVAAGSKDDGVAPESCKGPDRRAHGHGQGIDFVADPRPSKATVLDVELPSAAGGETRTIPYVEGSLGASVKVAAKLADLRFRLRDGNYPWQGQDLAGMLASHAQASDLSPWAEGIGFVDVDNIASTLPRVFPRQTGVTFQPFDLQAGKATGFAQVVVTGADAAAALATADTWTVEGGTQWRMSDDGWGGREAEAITEETPGHIGVHQVETLATPVAPDVTIVTMQLQAQPETASGGGWMGTPWAPPRDWLLPGLYSGRTWISTSTGILQLPINLGVGTIVDVYRFLAPDKPVGDTLVCLALPDIVGDVLGLRETSMELGLDEICLYVASTDTSGVARFYTPLPLIPYTLISWFDGRFSTRGGGVGKVYPHIEVGVQFPLPLNLAGILAFAGEAAGSVVGYKPPAPEDVPEEGLQLGWAEVDATPANETHPIYVRADLPYPLLYVPINMTFQLAIANNWRYRDNMETDHFVPVATTDILGVLDLLSGGRLPGFVSDVYFEAVQTSEVLKRTAEEIENQVMGTVPDDLPPIDGTVLDDILGQRILKALPGLGSIPGSCQWGYGHKTSPALTPEIGDVLADPGHGGWSAAEFLAQRVRPNVDREAHDPNQFAWPDTLVMRSRPTVESLVTMGVELPLCTAAYPFNVPQPNYYPTSVSHSFNLGLENTILIVCISAGMDTVCWILLPDINGILQVVPWELDAHLRRILKEAGGLVDFGVQKVPEPQLPLPVDLTGGVRDLARIPQLSIDLPGLPGLRTAGSGGRITLSTDLVTAGAQSGIITYTAIPLAVADSGLLDPLVGILTANGIDVHALAGSARLNMTTPGDGVVDGALDVAADLPGLVRDSIQDLLGIESRVTISGATFDLNAWWWDDSFFDAPIFPNLALPRSTTTDCVRPWHMATDPDLMGDPEDRWPAVADDPTCLRDADGKPILLSGTIGTPNGHFDLGEDWWWRTFPNVDRQLFERGMRYWDPETLVPDLERMQADGYPWAQPEMFEVLLEQFDDEEVQSTLPNQNHLHAGGGHNAHDFVSTATHCTRQEVVDLQTGEDKRDENGEYCYEGLLAFEEGAGYLFHDNDGTGSGIYDPDMGLGGVDVTLLPLLDLLGAPTAANPVVWSLGFQWGDTHATTPGLVEDITGHDPRELDWWSRDVSFTANRTIYTDQYTNTTLLLGDHFKACEEISLFSRAVLFHPAAGFDKRPRWQVACPLLPGPTAEAARALDPTLPKGFVPAGFADPDAPAYWDWQAGKMDMGEDQQLLTAPTVDGWVQEGPLLAPWLEPPGEAPAGQAWYASEGVRCRRERWMGWPSTADAQQRRDTIVRFFEQQAQPVFEVVVQAPEPTRSAVSGFKQECAAYDGWTYWVRAGLDFNGGAVPRSNAYIRNLHPSYANGTFALDVEAWNQCRATVDLKLDGWSCAAPDPVAQAWRDLLEGAAVRHDEYTIPATGAQVVTPKSAAPTDRYWVAAALDFFGLDSREVGYDYGKPPSAQDAAALTGALTGRDRTERVVTVPVAANPEGWNGNGADATEWDAFYRNMVFRQLDWNPNDPRVQVGEFAILQDAMADLSFLLRAYLEGDRAAALDWLASGLARPSERDPEHRKSDYYAAAPPWTSATSGPNPFWKDVSGSYVPYVELDRPRRDPTGAPCAGHFWMQECHRFRVEMDAGDLTGIRPQGPWEKDRTATGAPLPKDKTAFIPQGSAYARWNRDHRIPLDLPVAGPGDALAMEALHAYAYSTSSCPSGVEYWMRTPDTRHLVDGWTKAPTGPPGVPGASLPGWHALTACSTEPTPWDAWAALVHFKDGAYKDPDDYALPPDIGSQIGAAGPEDILAIKRLHAYYTYGETDINDPIEEARVTITTRERPSAEHPLGRDLGCWIDRRAIHGNFPPHLEFRPFETTFWDSVVRSGFYGNFEENAHQSWNGVTGLGGILAGEDYDAHYTEPVPLTRYGPWCVTPEGSLVPARSDREYIQQELAWDMQGGSRHADRTMLAPASPFGAGRPKDLDPLALAELLEALLNDVSRLLDQEIPVPDLSGAVADAIADSGLTNHTGDIADAAKQLRDQILALPLSVTLEASTPDVLRFDLASPVVPLAKVHVDPSVNVAEVAIRQSHSFPAGTQGIFLASLDGKTWHQVSGRLRVGVTAGDMAGSDTRMEFLDLSRFSGQTVTLGTQLLGAGWEAADWVIHGLKGFGSGVGAGLGPAMGAFDGSLAGATIFDPAAIPGQSWASLAALPAGSTVLLRAPLTIPAGATLQLSGVNLVAGQCGEAACPINVDGTLRMVGGQIAPATVAAPDASQVAQGAIVQVKGVLETLGTTIRGLLGGIHVLGGKHVARDCWMVDTGILGVASIFGELDYQDCVFVGQTVGIYTLGSRVRVEGNLFARMDRVAGAFDDSWGVLRGNAVLHADKAGFLVKGPLGAQNLAILDNHVRETATGMGSLFALEQRLLALDPLNGEVPVPARTRYQGNDIEFATLEGLLSADLSAPYFVGNDVTHNGYGANNGLLSGAVFRNNSLYTNFNGWMDPVRADPPQGTPWYLDGEPLRPFHEPVRRGPVPEDGNMFAGARGLSGAEGAMDWNYWGPERVGDAPEGRVPKGAAGDDRLTAPPDKPMMAALTAPAYGGGILPDLLDGAGNLLDPAEDILGVGGPSLPFIGMPDLVDVESVKLGVIQDREVPLQVDVPAGVSSVTVKATFRKTGFMEALDLEAIGDLVGTPLPDFVSSLRDLVGRILDPTVTRTETWTLAVPQGKSHVGHAFTFDGINEGYVDVEVESFTVDPDQWTPARMTAMGAEAIGPDTYRGDTMITKDVRVHNSITWPLLLDLTALVHDLTFTVIDDTLETVDQTVAGLGVPLAADFGGAGIPVVPMPDGTLPINGVPDLLTLAKDQDPVRGIEARFELGADATAVAGVLTGIGMDKTVALPDLPEGLTLGIQARAMDASNLVSPWVGVRMLTDLHAPTIDLDSECLSDNQGGIPYEAHEWRDPAWTAAHRPSGLQKVAFRVVPVVHVEGGPEPFKVELPFPGDDVVGSVAIPSFGMVDGMVYQVRGIAQDRAGNAGSDSLTRLVVDLSGPRIMLGTVLEALVDRAEGGAPYIRLEDLLDGKLLIRVDVEDGPEDVVAALQNSCGLVEAKLQMRTSAGGEWTTLASVAGGPDRVRADLDHDLDVLPALSGRYLELRVQARDGAGHQAEVTTGNLLADLSIPVPIALPDLPVCAGTTTGTLPIQWGGREVVPVGGAGSGIASGQLIAQGTASATTLDTFTAPAGTGSVQKPYGFDPVARLTAGEYILAVRVQDHAGNTQLWDRLAGLTPGQAADAAAIGAFALDTNLPAFTEATWRHWEGSVSKLLTTNPLNGDLVNVDAKVSDIVGGAYSCGLKLVQLFLDSAAGTELLREDRPTASPHTFYGAGVNFAGKTALDGRYATLRLRAEDSGGNVRETPSPTFLVDLTAPAIPALPTLPTCVGTAGATLSWTTADGAPPGTSYPYTASGVATDRAVVIRNGIDTAATVAPGGTWRPKTTSPDDHGANFGFRVEASDRAGNVATARLFGGLATVDLRGPPVTLGLGGLGMQLVPAPGGLDSGQIHVYATPGTDVGCAGATGLKVFLQRVVDGANWGTPVDITGVADWTDPLSMDTALWHRNVRYNVYAEDRFGNRGATVTTQQLHVDYRYPNLDLGSTATFFGRLVATGTDLGNPYTGVLDLGPGFGNEDGTGLATVVGPAARAVAAYSNLPIQTTLTLPGAVTLKSGPTATMDGWSVGLTGAGPWTYSYNVASASTNVEHLFTVSVTGSNGLTSTAKHRVFVPAEANVVLEEGTMAWVKAGTGTGDRVWSTPAGTVSYALRVDATASQSVDLRRPLSTPSPRYSVVADVYLDRKDSSGTLRVLDLRDAGDASRLALVLKDGSRELNLRTSSGDTPTGVTLPLGSYTRIALMLRGDLVELQAGGVFAGEYPIPAASSGLVALATGGSGGKLYLDNVQTHGLDLAVKSVLSRLPVGDPKEWTPSEPAVSITAAPASSTDKWVQVTGTSTGEAYSPPLQASSRSRVSLHFKAASSVATNEVARLVDSDGDAILTAKLGGNRLHVSDGASGFQMFSASLGTVWHRLDIYQEGSIYFAQLDHGQVLKLQADQAVPIARLAAGKGGAPLQVDDVRVLDTVPALDLSVGGGSLDGTLWTKTGTLGVAGSGHWTPYALVVNPGSAEAGFMAADLSKVRDLGALRGRFTAQVSFRPTDVAGAPDHQWLLAFADASASPVPQYGVFVRPHGSPPFVDGYDIVYRSPTGAETVLAWPKTNGWQTVQAKVDEPTGRVLLSVNDAVALDVTHAGLPVAARVVVGDIYTGASPSGSGSGEYDDLLVLPGVK